MLKAFSNRMKIYGPDSRTCLTSSTSFLCKRKFFHVSFLSFGSVVDGDYSRMGYDVVLIGS